MDVQESFLTQIIRKLMDKNIIQIIRNSSKYVLAAGMGGNLHTALGIFWELLQSFGGQLFNRLRERRSDSSIFTVIKEEILRFIRGLDIMTVLRPLIMRAMEFLQSLSGRAIELNPYGNGSKGSKAVKHRHSRH